MARSRKGVRRFVTGSEAARLIVLSEPTKKQASKKATTPPKDKPASKPVKPAADREKTCPTCHLLTHTRLGHCLHCSAPLTP